MAPPTSATSAPSVFDPCGELPSGTTVLEASAGTGKTHTIASLATRYVAEGHARIDELMLVTFGRAATVELRERVRERFVATAAALTDPEGARSSEDPVLVRLATGTIEEVTQRRDRLAHAVADFDAATIATTHGFAMQMLAGLGVAADVDPDLTFTETTADVTTEVAGDLYLRAYGRPDCVAPPIDLAAATRLAATAVADRQARLEPRDAEPGSVADVRRRFAKATRTQVEDRKRTRRLMDYDDLLVPLGKALRDPATGADARARIRSRYRIVLVDEFQDTDPVQWDILENTFHGHRTLVLIGDPKQAIYAFRGADVVTYLLAKESAAIDSTLGMNWRSDRPLVEGLQHLLGGSALGDPRIVVHEVEAAHQDASLLGAPISSPVRLRRVPRAEFGVSTKAKVTVGKARAFVAQDVAADVVRLLSCDAQVIERDGRKRPLEAADVAVLVHRNDDGALVRDAVAAVDVPVVFSATTSVFGSRAAYQWLARLSALEQPQRTGLGRNAALTDFLGWTAAGLATASDQALDELGATLRGWAVTLTDRGVAALLESAAATGLPRRGLAPGDGGRGPTRPRPLRQGAHPAGRGGDGGGHPPL